MNQIKSTVKEIKKNRVLKEYKLNIRKMSGETRPDLPKGVLHTMSARWGDIIFAIPSQRWCTQEEIVNMVWDQEKRNKWKSFNRSRRQVEDAIKDLTESTILLERIRK